jgi:hypothetical protein
MWASVSGGCLCGAVRYLLTAEPVTIYACHCSDCQRRTGSAFALCVLVRRTDVELTAGNLSACVARLDGGRTKRAAQCEVCGTRIWGELEKRPGMVVLQAGTLDDTRWVRPAAHVWTRSAQSWLTFAPGIPVYVTTPEDPSELAALWRRTRQNT